MCLVQSVEVVPDTIRENVPKCACSWIDVETGQPTKDNNDAIGMAICYDPNSFADKGSDPFPICEQHASIKKKWWKVVPLPGKTVAESHDIVIRDDVNFPKKVPTEVVVDSIRKAFANRMSFREMDELLSSLKYDHIMGNFYFMKWGMYVGIETDGTIHT